MTQQNRPRGCKFPDFYEDALTKLRSMGLSPPQIEALREYGLLATDNVTGFHEGRSGKGRFTTLLTAIRHVGRTGERVFYVEMDLQNLGGLNAALGHTGANRIYARVAAIVRQELSAVASEFVFFRHGGDEMSAFLIDSTGEAVREALSSVQARVSSLARRSHLDAIPHPKYRDDMARRGIGVHFGICQLTTEFENDPTLVFKHADNELERRKNGTSSCGCVRGPSSTRPTQIGAAVTFCTEAD